jgi:hypothetical protein
VKALVATTRTQGQDDGDFSWAVPGELVYLGVVCARDEQDPDGPNACGCAKAFTGLNSARATTTAEIREVELSADDIAEAVRSSMQQAGWTKLGVDPSEIVEELAGIVDEHEVGTVLGRRIDDLLVRA